MGGQTAQISSYTLRPLERRDLPAFRAIRLESLRLHPEAFGTAEEEESALSDRAFARLIPTPPGLYLGAFARTGSALPALVGVAGLQVPSRVKRRHKGFIFGVYVRAAHRRNGVARMLLGSLLEESARIGLTVVQLSVTAGNDRAMRLYESLGFRPFGTEHRALRVGNAYYDETLMEILLH
ncbi:MAG TPA: GNAT family protein [Acetobacteraceae bacterium]|nr:GNAT family protein [Acetobacteraceae bacterium]